MSRTKAPLVTELGEQYVNEFFRGAMYRRDNKLVKIHSCAGNVLRLNTLDNDSSSPTWETEYADATTLTGFSDVAWPKLGYRNFKQTKIGNVVVYVTAARSVFRGIRADNLNFEVMPLCETFGISVFSGVGAGSDKYRYLKVFFPEWIGYKEGMQQIRDNKIPAFALNEDMAISLSTESGNDRYCDIHFRQKVVGSISSNGEILLANRVIKKGHLKQLINMLEL